jgi:hypothetical protein
MLIPDAGQRTMNKKIGPYHIVGFPPERRAMSGFLDLPLGKHWMYGLVGGGCHGRQAIH